MLDVNPEELTILLAKYKELYGNEVIDLKKLEKIKDTSENERTDNKKYRRVEQRKR